jgi:hypothetical protein
MDFLEPEAMAGEPMESVDRIPTMELRGFSLKVPTIVAAILVAPGTAIPARMEDLAMETLTSGPALSISPAIKVIQTFKATGR